jgi:hypothetical protein
MAAPFAASFSAVRMNIESASEVWRFTAAVVAGLSDQVKR